QRVCWLRIADECSGAVLWTAVFPPGPLDSGPTEGSPGTTPPGLWPVGATRAIPGGQRRAVGLVGRPADRLDAVADRLGGGRGRGSPGAPPGQRGGGTFAGDRQTLGRASDLRRPGGAATAAGGHGPDPTAGISQPEGPQPARSLPATGPFRAGLYAGVGGAALGPGGGRGASGRVRGAATRGRDGVDLLVRPQPLRWHHSQEKDRVCHGRPRGPGVGRCG